MNIEHLLPQMLENLVTVRKAEVTELECSMTTVQPEQLERVTAKKAQVEQRFQTMSDPLTKRRAALEANRKGLELLRDIEEEKVRFWYRFNLFIQNY